MATCPHCGDLGAPTRGWCLVCGRRVDAALESRPGGTVPAPVATPPAPAVAATPAPPPVAVRVDGDAEAPRSDDVGDLLRDATTSSARPHAVLSLRARYESAAVPGDDPPLTGVLVEMTATGTPLREGLEGPVAHVIVALDVSASMDTPDKFPVLRAAVAQMLTDLATPDAAPVLVSFIIFAKGAEVVARDVLASRVKPAHLFETIHRHPLCFTRYTDVAGALDRAGRIAYDQALRCRTLPIRIYLLTDGRPQDLARARASIARCAKVPCDLHALAFGADADVRVLQDLFAGRRGGTVKSVQRRTLGDAFERIAEVAQHVVATQCRFSVELAPGVVGGAAYRYRPARVRFPDPAFEAGKRFHADLGTVEAARTYALLLELRPPETDQPSSVLGTVSVQIPSYGGPIVETLRLVLPRSPRGTLAGDVDPDVRAARDILGALDDADPQAALRALRLRRKLYEAERRDPGLLAILDRAIDLLTKTGSLAGLSPGEHATLIAHTCTAGSESGLVRETAATASRARR